MPNTIRNLSRAELYAVFKTDQAVKLVEELIRAINDTIPADVTVVQANLDAHIADPADAHQASAVGNTPAGNISATTVQAAINELDAAKQPRNASLPFLLMDPPEPSLEFLPGPQGPAGAAGAPGAPGAAGPAIGFLDNDDTSQDFIPGPQGPAGAAGAAGVQGPAGPAIGFLDNDDTSQDFIPGPQGPQGPAGATGSTGPAGADGAASAGAALAWVETDTSVEFVPLPGPAGAQGATGASGAAGPAGPALYLLAGDDAPIEMPPVPVPTATEVRVTGPVLSSGLGGIGYTVGAGGAVTQITSKATGVSLNFPSGQITLNAAALAANTTVSFTLTNSVIAATDTLDVHRKSGGTALAYNVWCDSIAAGSAVIAVRNISAGSLSEAVVLQFTVQKGSNT